MIPLVYEFPKVCTADCRNGDEGCCEEQWTACNPFPDGHCQKNCKKLNKCSDIKGCTTEDVSNVCISASSPSLPSTSGGCYIYSGGCDKISPDSCDNPINKKVCAHDDCYNGLEQCLQENQHSPSITKHTPWNPDSINYIKSQLAKTLNNIPKNEISEYSDCLITKARQNNISPYNFINSNDPSLQQDIATKCLATLRGNSLPSPPPSPDNFLDTTSGKIIVIVVIILILLGLTYFVTKTKKK